VNRFSVNIRVVHQSFKMSLTWHSVIFQSLNGGCWRQLFI